MTPSTTGLPQLLQRVRNRHLLLSDFLLLPIAAVLAFALRLDSTQLQSSLRTMLAYAAFAPLIMIPIFAVLGSTAASGAMPMPTSCCFWPARPRSARWRKGPSSS